MPVYLHQATQNGTDLPVAYWLRHVAAVHKVTGLVPGCNYRIYDERIYDEGEVLEVVCTLKTLGGPIKGQLHSHFASAKFIFDMQYISLQYISPNQVGHDW